MNVRQFATRRIRRFGASLPGPVKSTIRRSLNRYFPDVAPRATPARRSEPATKQPATKQPATRQDEKLTDWLAVDPRLVGSTYARDEVLPMLALENSVLHQRLMQAEDELETRRAMNNDAGEASAAATADDPQGTDAEEYCASAELADDYLAGQSLRTGTLRHLMIANDYPDVGREYGNGFVHRRVLHYLASGVDVDVVVAAPAQERRIYAYDGVRILVGHGPEIAEMLARERYRSVSVHFLNALMWKYLEPFLPEIELHVFLHGYECDRWIRRVFNFNSGTALERAIDRTLSLQRFWHQVVRHPHQPRSYIFVSEWWRRAVMDDMGLVFPMSRSRIVHNFIDTELFDYVPKNPKQRFRLLWLRSAGSRKYGNDLAIEILQGLSEGPFWSQTEVTVIGDGRYFHEFEEALGQYPNVSIERRFVSQEEVAALHKDHGMFLVPSRLDSQGVSRDEAMSSGLVPVTNAVTAIGEFVDKDCAILAGAEDARTLVDGIHEVMADPELFTRKSAAAARRAQQQCGAEATAQRELEVMGLTAMRRGEDVG